MNRWIQTATVACAVFFMGGVASASLFTDDFGRADGSVGGDWISAGVASWAIQSSQLVETGGNAAASYLVNTNAQAATTTSALSFNVTVEAKAGEVNDMTGIVWNWQDANNYQFYRMRWGNGTAQLEVGQVVGGVQSLVYSKQNNELASLFTSAAYIFTLAYDQDSASYTINMPPTTNPTGERNLTTFSTSEFSGVATGGGSGIYSLFKTDAGNTFDNFSVTTIPEPATVGLVVMSSMGIVLLRKIMM